MYFENIYLWQMPSINLTDQYLVNENCLEAHHIYIFAVDRNKHIDINIHLNNYSSYIIIKEVAV